MNDDILAALKTVIDPELGINIVDLGLVYHAAHNADGIDIALTMTTPACPLGEMITEEIKLVLRDRFPDTPAVRVELVWDPPWLGSTNLAMVAAFPLSSKNTGHM
jgi:metal-sulfur cluster biosynthetic enzyme